MDADEDAQLLLMTALPGARLDQAQLSTDQEKDAYRQTGRLLRRFHEAGPRQVVEAVMGAGFVSVSVPVEMHPAAASRAAVRVKARAVRL
ncbi:hypothetical protein OHV13_33175 [Kitasatospora purpeofusca]|uniref:hypothetical protein n=1 Tax=Kitasatospora purpeofusca TaxID=67352 RepID=UPI0032554887